MIKATHKTIVNASLEDVAYWFQYVLPNNYLTIHPKDHLELTKLSKPRLQMGSIFRLREKIGGRLYLSTQIRITELTDSSFAFEGLFPYSFVDLRARFSLREVSSNQTEIVAENYAGYDLPILGWILDQLMYLLLPYPVLKQHMLEENNGIKAEIEKYVAKNKIKPVTPNKIWHSPLNFYHHFQKLVDKVGLQTIESKGQYQQVREAQVGAVLSLIMLEKFKKPTYFQIFHSDPPDLILMDYSEETGTRNITQIEVTHYTGKPKDSLLDRVKRKDPPGRHHYSDNYILVFNVGIGLTPNYEEAREYLEKNQTPFPVWAIQEIPGSSNTTARLVIVNPEVYETTVDIGLAANKLQKLNLPDVIQSRRAGSLKAVRMEKGERFEKAPWETIGMN